ncbi:MAG: aldehyde dehydrogenase family protein, partial [Planctomycetes bacterium]|nr:aldehyde dehydrogenase family protein [Planctomycetota bacterium]
MRSAEHETVRNIVGGRPVEPERPDRIDVTNPATGAVLARLPLSTAAEVAAAVESAREAFSEWSRTPVPERLRVLFRFREKLKEHVPELAELIVTDNGKTLAEARGSIQRGLEAVEFATSVVPYLMGSIQEDVASGIDCELHRQPLGVVAAITPFNFPVMVPLWMAPVALACGNTVILKPAEKAPLAAARLAEIF